MRQIKYKPILIFLLFIIFVGCKTDSNNGQGVAITETKPNIEKEITGYIYSLRKLGSETRISGEGIEFKCWQMDSVFFIVYSFEQTSTSKRILYFDSELNFNKFSIVESCGNGYVYTSCLKEGKLYLGRIFNLPITNYAFNNDSLLGLEVSKLNSAINAQPVYVKYVDYNKNEEFDFQFESNKIFFYDSISNEKLSLYLNCE